MTLEKATNTAILALQHLAGDPEQLSRFIGLSGLDPTSIRQQASSPAFLAAVLDYFLQHEPSLLACAASIDVEPADFAKARFALVPPDTVEGWN